MKLPLLTDVNLVPYLANVDADGNLAMPVEQYILSSGIYLPVSMTNPLPNRGVGSMQNIFDGSFTFANSATAGTVVNLAIPLPSVLNDTGLYKITVVNPSGITSLSIDVENKETINSVARYPSLLTIGVNPSGDMDFVVQGLFGEAANLAISNNGALSSSDGFTGYVRVRKI